MKYAVVTKGVPDFRHGKVVFKEDNTLNRAATPTVMNPNDILALQAALEAKVKYGGEVHVISMGPPPYKKVLQEAMSQYADRLYLLSDPKFAAADTLATAEVLSSAIKKIGGIDIIFAGFKTADGETGQTGPQTAWLLRYTLATHVLHCDFNLAEKQFTAMRSVKDEIEHIKGTLPAFLVTDPGFVNNYRTAQHRLYLQDLREETLERSKRFEEFLTIWSNADLGLDEWKVGIKGSPTIVESVDPIPRAPSERKAKILDGTNLNDLRQALELMAQARN